MSIDILRHKFCVIIYCTSYILLFIVWCHITDIYGGRGVFGFTARWRTGNYFMFILSQPISAPRTSRSRLYKGDYFICFLLYYYLTVFLIILLLYVSWSPFYPRVTCQPWLRPDVLDPNQVINCWREPYVPGFGLSWTGNQRCSLPPIMVRLSIKATLAQLVCSAYRCD